MIDFAGLVGKITGKTAMSGPGTSAEPGVATGGEFAALVQFAAQAGLENGQAKLKLVVDNGIVPNGAASDAAIAAMLSELTGETLETDPKSKDETSGKSEESETATDQDSKSGQFTVPMPIVAPWSAVPVQQAPVAANGEGSADAVAAAGSATAGQAGGLPVAMTSAEADKVVQDDAKQGATGHPADAKHNILATALRALSPRSRPDAATEKADAAVQISAAAAVAASDEARPTTGTKASASAAVQATDATVSAASAPSPLRTIVDALPPVVQSELGTPSIRAVAGPSTGEALGDQVIDMGVSGQWIDRMAREIAGLAEGNGHSRFTLNPPHLGKLQVDLWQDAGATNVRLLTETDEAARRLAEGRPALQADARIAALGFGTITVEKSSASADSSFRDQSNGARQGGDLSGQAQQQSADGRAQSGTGNARGSDWIGRSLRNDDNQTHDASARAPDRAANGRVRFA